MAKQNEYKKLIDALNLMDEIAEQCSGDITEQKARAKAYDMLFKHLTRAKQEVTIPFSENDIQELQSGEELNWSFPNQYGEDIEIFITQEEDNEEE